MVGAFFALAAGPAAAGPLLIGALPVAPAAAPSFKAACSRSFKLCGSDATTALNAAPVEVEVATVVTSLMAKPLRSGFEAPAGDAAFTKSGTSTPTSACCEASPACHERAIVAYPE